MGVFQCNVFQNNVFQGPCGVVATATTTALYGHWRGPGGRRHRPGLQGRIRLLSELDPPKPLSAPDTILDLPPIDKAALEAMVMEGIGRRDLEIARLYQRQQREALLRALADDDDNFMVM